jgi:predicted site-specific integrase-resolvase
MRSPKNPIPRLKRVIPIQEWCEYRGISYYTARRLRMAGKLKITQISPGRIGVREDHDAEYLASCAAE